MTFVGQYKKRAGFTAVFPNYKHANRTDGIGLARLSPMSLGPVRHGMKGVPDARNLENMHQFSKEYPNESRQEFEAARAKAFQDPVPKRHKRRGVKPKGWIWEDPTDGKRYCLSWVRSRQFYCNWYERMVREQPEWAKLQALARTTKVLVVGYDAHPVDDGDWERAYLQSEVAFGHERVLACMLSVEDEAQWPWRKHKTFQF